MGDPNRDSAWWVRGRNEISLHIAVKFISGTYSHEHAGHQSLSQALTEQVSGNEGKQVTCVSCLLFESCNDCFFGCHVSM